METKKRTGRLGDEINELVMSVKLMAIGDIASGVAKGEVLDVAKQKLESMLESAKQKGDQEIINGFKNALIRIDRVD